MTESTVPVPVDLLKRLFDHTILTRDAFEGDSVSVRPPAIGALIDIKALIPTPPKVGDVLTADQVRDLPSASVLRDQDGDVMVKVGDGVHRVTMDLRYPDSAEWNPYEVPELLRSYTVTLVSLPVGD